MARTDRALSPCHSSKKMNGGSNGPAQQHTGLARALSTGSRRRCRLLILATERVSGKRRAEPLHGNVPRLIVVVERKPHLESDLVMRHRAVFDMAARLHYLEPADLTERARSAADGVLDRVLDALLRGTGDLDNPVNVIGIVIPPWPGGSSDS